MQIAIGVFLAVALNGARYEKILVTALLMPMMMAPIVAGLVWYFLYNGTFGWYHWLFQSAGILGAKSILASPSTALYGIIIVDVWQWTPLITLITLAGLKRVPQDQLEANMVDGASPLRNGAKPGLAKPCAKSQGGSVTPPWCSLFAKPCENSFFGLWRAA